MNSLAATVETSRETRKPGRGAVCAFTRHPRTVARIPLLELRPAARSLLGCYLSLAGPEGACWPSKDQTRSAMTRSKCGRHYSIATLVRERTYLARAGLIELERVPPFSRFPGRGEAGELVPGGGKWTRHGGTVVHVRLEAIHAAADARGGRSPAPPKARGTVLGRSITGDQALPDLERSESPSGSRVRSQAPAAAPPLARPVGRRVAAPAAPRPGGPDRREAAPPAPASELEPLERSAPSSRRQTGDREHEPRQVAGASRAPAPATETRSSASPSSARWAPPPPTGPTEAADRERAARHATGSGRAIGPAPPPARPSGPVTPCPRELRDELARLHLPPRPSND
jgi:hypothetical protein